MNKTFGQIIKEKRLAHGLTQWQLAEKAGVSQHAISYWENDEHYPNIFAVIEIADFFKCPIDELVGRKI